MEIFQENFSPAQNGISSIYAYLTVIYQFHFVEILNKMSDKVNTLRSPKVVQLNTALT